MSRRRNKTGVGKSSQASQNVSMENDDEEPSHSQVSQATDLSPDEQNQLVGSLIKYILAAGRSKHVIQRQHLVKNVFGNYIKYYRNIMTTVKHTLLQVFGFNLVEFTSGKYLLTNAIPNDTPHLVCPINEQPRRILLVLVLTHIFMVDDTCEEDSLWSFLRRLTIISEDHFNNNYFGDVKKLITVDFVKEQYIDMLRIGTSEPPLYEFQWGPRAEEEVSKRQILQFVSKMHHNRPINKWPKQFNALEVSERVDRNRGNDN